MEESKGTAHLIRNNRRGTDETRREMMMQREEGIQRHGHLMRMEEERWQKGIYLNPTRKVAEVA
jgi:hypothetical protein